MQVLAPPALFRSVMPSSAPFEICCPSTPSEPVSDITAPIVVVQAAMAGAATPSVPSAPSATPQMANRFIMSSLLKVPASTK